MKFTCPFYAVILLMVSCAQPRGHENNAAATNRQAHSALRDSILSIIGSYRAVAGVAIITPDGDTLSCSGDKRFALMSVCKLPQALAFLHLVDEGKISMDEQIIFDESDMKQRTSSGIRKDHPRAPFSLSIDEVLRYAISESDNVTSNKMFELAGGPSAVEKFVHSHGINDMGITADYTNLYKDVNANWSTPKAMVQLLEQFYQRKFLTDKTHELLWTAMVNAVTGSNRIKGMLPEGTVVAHKTGTGNTNRVTGKIEAFNDAGIVLLPDGRHFCIAVFIADSQESEEKTAEIIARVTREVWEASSNETIH